MSEYEKFLELPKEKQLKIINAGFEYFGKYGYKGANTEDIANRAEILCHGKHYLKRCVIRRNIYECNRNQQFDKRFRK